MSTAERIYEQARELPEPVQEAVLRIVELLTEKPSAEDEAWSRFSLSAAARGMEDETWPDYTTAPLFETWR